MTISILSSTNYSYSGQADSRSYTSASGTNTLLVVCVAAQGFSSVPTRAVTYNGVSLTQQVVRYGGFSPESWSEIWTLVSPATGSNTLYLNFHDGSNGGVNVSVYTLGGVSNAPIETTYSYDVSNPNYNYSYTSRAITPTSNPGIIIDSFIGKYVWTKLYNTLNGSISTYATTSSLSSTTFGWSTTEFYPAYGVHTLVSIRADKSFSISDTIASGDSNTTVKGLLIQVANTIVMSETYTQIRKVFMTFTDTIKIYNRGWFGRVADWLKSVKNSATWTDSNRS